MTRVEPWPRGSGIVWRSLPQGQLGYVFACRVLADDPEMAVIVQPAGAAISRRAGKRGGPRGRQLLPGGWDGQREASVWDGPPMVRVHPVGAGYSLLRAWQPDTETFKGWYVNLEKPWQRTPVGFDSCDNILDLTISDELRTYTLKDDDELRFAKDAGLLDQAEVDHIWATAHQAISDLENRRLPFDEEWWLDLPVSAAISRPPPQLPDGWDRIQNLDGP